MALGAGRRDRRHVVAVRDAAAKTAWSRFRSIYRYEEAATLPCAGVTAWNALVTRGHTNRAISFCCRAPAASRFSAATRRALGGKPVITSSSDDKLARARQLGAVATHQLQDDA